MRRDLTDLTMVIDRSGSMSAIKDDAEGGINQFIDNQKDHLLGDCLLTLVQFDTKYDFVHKGKPIKDVDKYTLVPRGNTALLDAVGRAIVETGERLKAMAEADRPGLVVFVIVTDGQENSSQEFKLAKIKEMIQHQQDAYKWQFTFLSSGLDAFGDAAAMGITRSATSPMALGSHVAGYAGASANVARMRSATMTGGKVVNSYTDDERKAMNEEKK